MARMNPPASPEEPRRSRGTVLSLRARALRWLSQREHTRQELSRKLQAHCSDADDLPALLDDLTRRGWLSDDRAAASVVHRQANRLGVARIRQELKQKGVAADTIDQAVEALQDTEVERAQRVWAQRFGPEPPADLKARARQLRFLMARGFPGGLAARTVPEAVRVSVDRVQTMSRSGMRRAHHDANDADDPTCEDGS